jgi:hypothetical protein
VSRRGETDVDPTTQLYRCLDQNRSYRSLFLPSFDITSRCCWGSTRKRRPEHLSRQTKSIMGGATESSRTMLTNIIYMPCLVLIFTDGVCIVQAARSTQHRAAEPAPGRGADSLASPIVRGLPGTLVRVPWPPHSLRCMTCADLVMQVSRQVLMFGCVAQILIPRVSCGATCLAWRAAGWWCN